ncbi:hypothetical protein BDP27DRAFT_1313260 [Rhodocollybia butyracea]|uniref:Uncharacterized protein n=1 Tax=Rhodocollybia butyracea TaxID=206335 RepID=A0A9P5UDN1_9AGAR|nr:hypothetical protein BDP27DRAFT_1313260 [Rhodocollybia butyracea]
MDTNGKEKEWGASGSNSAFSGLGRGKRGAERGGRGGRGRGAGRGIGSTRGSRGRSRGASGSGTESSETSKKPTTSRRRSSAKSIPSITVPPPSASMTRITVSNSDSKIQEINALVEHTRAGALTPSAPITPFTPSHIDWAGEDDDDGSLPDLNDWGVNTAGVSGTFPEDKHAISPILVEGLKSLPEPNVPEHPEPEEQSTLHPSLPQKPKQSKVAAPAAARERTPRPPREPRVPKGKQPAPTPKPVSGGVSLSTAPDSSRIHPQLALRKHSQILDAPKPTINGLTSTSKPGSYVPPHTRNANVSPSSNSGNTSASKPHPRTTFNPKSAFISTPTAPAATRTQAIPAPIAVHPPPTEVSANSNSNMNASNGGLKPQPQNQFTEFTFPSLSPSPISGHYPSGPRGPGGTPVSTEPNGSASNSNGSTFGARGGVGGGRGGFGIDSRGGRGGAGAAPRHFNNTNNNLNVNPRQPHHLLSSFAPHASVHQRSNPDPNADRTHEKDGDGDVNSREKTNSKADVDSNSNSTSPPKSTSTLATDSSVSNHSLNTPPRTPPPPQPDKLQSSTYLTPRSSPHPPHPHKNHIHSSSAPHLSHSHSQNSRMSPHHNTHSHSHSQTHSQTHSREHSISRPVITGDAISKLARTIAASPGPRGGSGRTSPSKSVSPVKV